MENNIFKHEKLQELESRLLKSKIITKEIDANLLDNFDVFCFDIDHTLALYNHIELGELLYKCFSENLVYNKDYPKELLISENENNYFSKSLRNEFFSSDLFIDKVNINY